MAPYDPTDVAHAEDLDQLLAEAPPTWEIEPAASSAEPTGGAIVAERAPAAPEALPIPLPPIPLPLRNVSGSYVGVSGVFELDLRVDVDGARPTRRVSGDFLQISGSTRNYFGSFVVDNPTITATSAGEVVRGPGRFTFSAGAPVVQVTIPRRRILQPPAPATVRFFTTANQPGATYVCNYSSGYFRTVTLQTESVSDVADPVFASYNTGLLPSGGPARTLSVVSAYGEAGVQILPVASGPVINISEAKDRLWSDAELMASMKLHFARIAPRPHWDMWQVVCNLHEPIFPGADPRALLGIMFDIQGRQGSAVFYGGFGMPGAAATALRQKLYTHVHEAGHGFNLMHSWQKSFAKPPGVNNPSALSWMNYPQNYPGGANAFWAAFPFQFIPEELVHIRHGFRNDVIPVANPFGIGAGEIDPAIMADPIEDISGIEFAISGVHAHCDLGEPVVLDLRLSSFDRRGRIVHDNLHPSTFGVSIAIARPDGRVVLFEPLVEHLLVTEPQLLPHGEELSNTAYIGYGRGGLYFDQPGTYRVRAIYHAPDGSQVLSNIAGIRVRYPATPQDNEVADLMIGDQQGELFALRGSDDKTLADGNAALETVIEKHGSHPLAAYARYVKGIDAARTFKTIDHAAPERVRIRKPDLQASQTLLSAATAATSRLDKHSKAQGLNRLAAAQHASGDAAGARQTERLVAQLSGTARR